MSMPTLTEEYIAVRLAGLARCWTAAERRHLESLAAHLGGPVRRPDAEVEQEALGRVADEFGDL